MTNQQQWELLKQAYASGRLGHAYLFAGSAQSGQEGMVRRLAQMMQCRETQQPCGACRVCRDIERGRFADFLAVRSSQSESSQKNETDMMEISVDQVREVRRFLSLKPHYGLGKCVLIENAERMSQEAQNCFLKLLEEPKGNTVIVLTAAKPELLLATVRSRCRTIRWRADGSSAVSGAESAALAQLERVLPAGLAEKFAFTKHRDLNAMEFETLLNAARRHFRGVLLKTIASPPPDRTLIKKASQTLGAIESMSRQASTGAINRKLAIEVLLMDAT